MMKNIFNFFLHALPCLLIILHHDPGYAQSKRMDYHIQSTFVTGTGNAPAFWGFSNQYGTISVQPNSALIRTGIFIPFDTSPGKRLDYSMGLDILNRVDQNYNMFLQQCYINFRYRIFNLQGGRQQEIFGNQDSSLSSGGLLWSGNAPPMPKITAGILNYTPVPFTKGFFEIKGAISHGWFGNKSYVNHEWLHHKYIYIRAGGNFPVKINFGFHHFVQWGGISPTDGPLPSSWKDFWIIFRARQLDTTGMIHPNSGVESEYSNRIGNHLGMRDFGLDFTGKHVTASLYFQSYFEDNSSLHWHNLPDGLYGVYVKLKRITWLRKVVFEYVATTNQSEPYRQHTPYPGSDNLFNNAVYVSGWTYNYFTLGTPFITSPLLLKKNGIPTDILYDYLRNNRIMALHLGMEGIIAKIQYRWMITHIKNYGTYNFPMDLRRSTCTILEVKKQEPWCGGLEIGLSIASDFGNMYRPKTSFILTLRKSGLIFK